jgi:hypothetical protein
MVWYSGGNCWWDIYATLSFLQTRGRPSTRYGDLKGDWVWLQAMLGLMNLIAGLKMNSWGTIRHRMCSGES